MLEFTLPAAGMYMLVDHDNLRYLSYGFAIAFVAGPEQPAMHAMHEDGMHH